MITISFAINAETPEQGALTFNAIINDPLGPQMQLQLNQINQKLDEIKAEIAKQAIQQPQLDELVQIIQGNKGKLTAALDNAEN